MDLNYKERLEILMQIFCTHFATTRELLTEKNLSEDAKYKKKLFVIASGNFIPAIGWEEVCNCINIADSTFYAYKACEYLAQKKDYRQIREQYFDKVRPKKSKKEMDMHKVEEYFAEEDIATNITIAWMAKKAKEKDIRLSLEEGVTYLYVRDKKPLK